MKYSWFGNNYEIYRPEINRKAQAGLFSLILADIVLPMTFGIGFFISKQLIKYKPLLLYK